MSNRQFKLSYIHITTTATTEVFDDDDQVQRMLVHLYEQNQLHASNSRTWARERERERAYTHIILAEISFLQNKNKWLYFLGFFPLGQSKLQ